jgi:hypothetical protein
MIARRTAGAALLVYAVATFAANTVMAAPGGEYDPNAVANYISSGHYAIAFAAAYLGCLGALALLPFVLGVRAEVGRLGELAWSLGVAAATTGVIGWLIAGGVDVAMAEGGSDVRAAVTNPTIYVLTEIGNLLSWCAPALFMGVVAILLSRAKSLPYWLRVFSLVAGVCGILAAFFFTYFVYLLWTLVLGLTMVARASTSAAPHVQPSLV